MRNTREMTKAECISAIKRMFGFDTYKGYFSEQDDVETLRSLVQAQLEKYVAIRA